jgi:hypothetical protein
LAVTTPSLETVQAAVAGVASGAVRHLHLEKTAAVHSQVERIARLLQTALGEIS